MSCKNSCIRLCLPSFMSEIVDQPQKMFDVSTYSQFSINADRKQRFWTNCKGNAAKKGRNDLKKAQVTVAGTDRNQCLNSLTRGSAGPRKLDQLTKPPISQANASKGPKRKSISSVVHRVTKRRLPSRGTPKYYGEDSKDNSNEDTDSDEFDGDSIHVAMAPSSNSIDPTLLLPHSQADIDAGGVFGAWL